MVETPKEVPKLDDTRCAEGARQEVAEHPLATAQADEVVVEAVGEAVPADTAPERQPGQLVEEPPRQRRALAIRLRVAVQPEPPGPRDFDARVAATVVAGVAERVTQRGVRGPALERWAEATSRMLAAYLGL